MYMLVDSSPFELPLGVYDSLKEISVLYDIPYMTVRIACSRHRLFRSLDCYVIKVTLD